MGVLFRGEAHLDETNVLSILPEALTADVQPVLADETPLVGTHTAAHSAGLSCRWPGRASSRSH